MPVELYGRLLTDRSQTARWKRMFSSNEERPWRGEGGLDSWSRSLCAGLCCLCQGCDNGISRTEKLSDTVVARVCHPHIASAIDDQCCRCTQIPPGKSCSGSYRVT